MHSTHTAFKQGVIEDTEDNDRPGTRTGLGGVLGIIQHGGMGSSIGIDLFTNQDIVTFAKYYCIFSYLVRQGLYHKHLVWRSTIWETIESRLLQMDQATKTKPSYDRLTVRLRSSGTFDECLVSLLPFATEASNCLNRLDPADHASTRAQHPELTPKTHVMSTRSQPQTSASTHSRPCSSRINKPMAQTWPTTTVVSFGMSYCRAVHHAQWCKRRLTAESK
jgi:hypothetical protein